MPKILRIINRFNLGGPTYNAVFLSAFLSDQFQTRLIGGPHESNEGSSLFIPEKYGVKAQIVPEFQRDVSIFRDSRAIKAVRKIIREYRPDIVHTHASKAGAIGRIAAFREKVPVVVHTFHGHVFHSYFGSFKTAIYKNVERWLARKTSAIIAISPRQLEELTQEHGIAPVSKFSVIPLGFDLDRFCSDTEKKRITFRTAHGIDDQTVAIAIIGRLTSIKNHAGFFEIIRQLGSCIESKFAVFVVGNGELYGQLKTQTDAIERELNRKIFHFTSWIEDIAAVLPGFDIVALNSFNEGTPVSLIEAQAAGVPVITSDTGGIRDVVPDGAAGFVVPLGNTDLYISRLQELILDKKLRQFMSQNGLKHVQERYNFRRLCTDTESLYLNLMRNTAR